MTNTWTVNAPAKTQIIRPPQEEKAAAPNESAKRLELTVLLREEGGEQLGSGVLVSLASSGAWVATNRHVIANQERVCVETANRRSAAAFVLPQSKERGSGQIDIALIWLPADERNITPATLIEEEPYTPQSLPLVVATGFPTPLNPTVDSPQYSEQTGLLVPLLSSPIQDGLDLTYTADVKKGMSGGGVFLGSDLIGINSAHRDPLWPGQWRDGRGRVVDEKLNKKLDLVSLGISAKEIKKALIYAKQPSADDLNSLVSFKCNRGQRGA